MKTERENGKPVIEVMNRSYQPKKSELKEKVYIDAEPEQLARLLGRQVIVKEVKPGK